MPLYEYQCSRCDMMYTEFRPVAICDDPGPDCCGAPSRKIISISRILKAMEPYQSPVDGRVIRNERERRSDLQRHGCRPWEGRRDEEIEAARIRKYADAEADKKLGDTVEKALYQTYEQMPQEKRKALRQYHAE